MNLNSHWHSGFYFIVIQKVVKITDLLAEDINQFPASVPFFLTPFKNHGCFHEVQNWGTGWRQPKKDMHA